MFHNVVPVADEQLNPRNISVKHFAGILDYIRKHYQVVPLRDLKYAKANSGMIAITFDDGLVNNLKYAAKVLVERNLPATFFVCTPRLFGNEILWPDELSLLLKTAGERVSFNGRVFTKHYRSHFREIDTNKKLEDVLLNSSHELIDRFLDTLRKNQDSGGHCNGWNEDFWRVMKGEEVKLLSEIPGMNIGAHGITHRNLVGLSDEDLKEELQASRKYLSDVLSVNVDMIAWPFGLYDDRICSAAKDAGYSFQIGVQKSDSVKSELQISDRLGIYNDVGLIEHLHQINTFMR